MKIAIFSTGDLSDFKGVMNYVHEKSIRFRNVNNTELKSDLFFLVTKYIGVLGLIKRLKGERTQYKDGDKLDINGLTYNIVVQERDIFDILASVICGRFISSNNIKKIGKIFENYDIISAHQLTCQYIACKIKKNTGKPFIATWHGSDINVSPRKSKRNYEVTKLVMESAEQNYFVSKALMVASDYISKGARKNHIYTGPSSIFYKYSEKERLRLRRENNVEGATVITFSGNLIDIKNVLVLPGVFKRLNEKLHDYKLAFWIIGNGYLGDELKKRLIETGVNFKMFGKIEASKMPDYMNCTDILILPSLNEGFPLSILEARACGSHVVASKVGGLPESAGEKNCFQLGADFEESISNRMAEIILMDEDIDPLPEEYSWESAINKEVAEINEILNK